MWTKRRRCCREAACDAKTWTESSAHVDAQLRAGNRCLDKVRRRLCLRVGDPADEMLVAWLVEESVRDGYLAENPAEAAEPCRLRRGEAAALLVRS